MPAAGDSFRFGGAEAVFVSPLSEHEDLNDNSLVLRVTYGSTAFLFMADAGKEAEAELLASGQDISADVIKIAHHGSSGSTSGDFIKAVDPDYAIISVGADNDQNHPSPKVMDILSAEGIAVLRTDQLGTIVCRSDGKEIVFENIRTPESDSYDSPFIGNIKTMKFHKSGCKWAQNIAEANRVPFETAEQAVQENFAACKVCRPK